MSAKRFLAGCVLLVTTAACDSSTAPSGTRVGLSFSGVRPAGVAAGFMAQTANAVGDSLSVTDGTNTLVITKVEVVAREIELRRVGITSCDSSASTDDCESFSTNAQLVVLPLAQASTQVLTVDVPAGTYSSMRLKVHKVSDDVGDAAFLVANPTWPARQSIRVTGFYNGTAFTYLSDVNFHAEQTLTPNLVVDATTATNLTVRIDLSIWFRNGATGPLIDPTTAGSGGANKSVVENNIKNSVKAFEDKDRDGDERDG
ncbi:MAG: hypothetical protein K8S21_13040 [Gemmatimonadetes bacterium]|nr:hypothetical protein [Gemmatimonadota bacterium]